jgi:hypothetical protein
MKGVRRNSEQGICPICSKEEQWNLILKYKGIKIWRDEILKKRFRTNIMFLDFIHRHVCISKYDVSENPSSGKTYSVAPNR